MSEPVVLGIESTCDETAAAVVRGRTLLSNVVASSMDEHAKYGGVIPEIASRAHAEVFVPVVSKALKDADMALADGGMLPHLAAIAGDIDDGADHGALWFAKLSGLKHRAVVAAKQVVDEAMLVAGGSSYFTRNELSRLYRDVLAGMFHPSDPESVHSTVATAWLGPVSS